MALKLTPNMSTSSEKKFSDFDKESEDHFSFPIFCIPMKLRPKAIYRIMTISDLVLSLFNIAIATVLATAFAVGIA